MYKQVIVIRKDLKLSPGKVASQAAHAAIGALNQVDSTAISGWVSDGSKKVVLKVDNLKELKVIEGKIKKAKVPCFLVKDAGLTQLEPGTVTALGIGPAKEKSVDTITGKLKLF